MTLAGADEILNGTPPAAERTVPDIDPLEGLNARQQEAVTAPDGPTLVLAGPGSGKTRVITSRIAHLVVERQIPPDAIAAITFTRKAADEMRERVCAQLGRHEGEQVRVSTFHGLCGQILRAHGDRTPLGRRFEIAQTGDRFRLMAEAARETLPPGSGMKPRAALQKVSDIKNRMEEPSDPAQWEGSEDLARMAAAYQEGLTAENKIDFDDMMLWSIRLLHDNPDVRARTEDEHPWVLVDEYQDTNLPQYVLIRQLTEERENLFAVGDPDQAIYEWRGASVENIMRFEEDFPGSRRIELETTYRSTGNILEAASALISPNETRIERTLTTTQESGAPVTIHAARTPREEARYAAGVAAGALENGTVAVLYRTNAQARAMEDQFKRAEVPYEIAGGQSFYRRQEVIDGLCCLEVAVDPRADDEATKRFLQMPPGERLSRSGAGQVDFCGDADEPWYDKLLTAVADQVLNARDERAARKRIDKIETLGQLRDRSPAEIIEEGLRVTGYTQALRESDEQGRIDKIENLEELVQDAIEYAGSRRREDGGGPLSADFAARCREMQDAADTTRNEGSRATLSTLHAAKGLEFDTVVLAGFDSLRLPHHRTISESRNPGRATEEERRLAYVGMTRAKRELHLSYPRTIASGRSTKHAQRSPFLASIPSRLLKPSHAKAPAGAPEPTATTRAAAGTMHNRAQSAEATPAR